MKTLITALTFTLTTVFTIAQTPSQVEYYDNGKVKVEYFAQADGMIDAKFYYSSGQLREVGQFKDLIDLWRKRHEHQLNIRMLGCRLEHTDQPTQASTVDKLRLCKINDQKNILLLNDLFCRIFKTCDTRCVETFCCIDNVYLK